MLHCKIFQCSLLERSLEGLVIDTWGWLACCDEVCLDVLVHNGRDVAELHERDELID